MLEKQYIEVPFGGGLDQKTDEKHIVPGKLKTLLNGDIVKGGRIQRRKGYDLLAATGYVRKDGSSQFPTAATAPDDGAQIAPFFDELVLFDGNHAWSRFDDQSKWAYRSGARSCVTSIQRTKEESLGVNPDRVDTITHGGLTVVVAGDPNNNVWWNISDASTGLTVSSGTGCNATTKAFPRLAACGNNILLFYADSAGSNIYVRILDTSSVATSNAGFGSEITLYTTNRAGRAFDVSSSWSLGGTDVVALVHHTTTAATARIALIDSNGTVIGSPAAATFTGDWPSPGSVQVTRHSTLDRLLIVWTDGTDVRYHTYVASTLAVAVVPTVLASPGAATTVTIASANSTNCRVYYSYSSRVYCLEVVIATAAATATLFDRPPVGYALASKAWAYDGFYYVALSYDSDAEGHYAVFRHEDYTAATQVPLNPVARFAHRTSGELNVHLSNAYTAGTGVYAFGGSLKTRVRISSTGLSISHLVPAAFTIDFGNTQDTYVYETANRNLHVTGGQLWGYDGDRTVEHGFLFAPEAPTAVDSGGGTGPTGTFYYKAVYEWYDAKGQRHQSAPSLPSAAVSVTDNTVTVTTVPYNCSQKAGEVAIGIYRSSDGILYQRVNGYGYTVKPSSTATSYVLGDSLADNSSREILYTTGGILENDAPPSCTAIASHAGRVWVNDRDLTHRVWPSKQVVGNEGVAWSAGLAVPVGVENDEVTALASLDDKLIVFKRTRIYAVSGEGPNDAGQGNPFSVIEIPSHVGCVSPRAVCRIPQGLLFKSERGWWLLGRGMDVKYVGAAVEDYNAYDVNGVVLDPINGFVFITHDSTNDVLVYFLEWDQWGTRRIGDLGNGFRWSCSAMWQDRHCLVRYAVGTVFKQSTSTYADNSIGYDFKLTTAWIRLAGMMGLQRVRRANFYADWQASHHLTITPDYDYGEVSGTGREITRATSSHEVSVHIAKQKCKAIRFTLTDYYQVDAEPEPTDFYPVTDTYAITGLQLEIARKAGLGKKLDASTQKV